jgi:hypothetical protein
VSDRYGAALWAVDQALFVAALGVTGENFHSNIAVCGGPKPPGSAYTPFCAANAADQAAGKLVAQPELYALRLVREVGTGTFAPVDNDDPATLRAHALRNGKQLRVVLVNLQDTGDRALTVNLGGVYKKADVVRLTGPSLDAATGITLGGGAARADGTFPPLAHAPIKVTGHVLSLTMPPASAALVTLRP